MSENFLPKKTHVWAGNFPFLEIYRQILKILNIHNFLCPKFASVCRKIATSCRAGDFTWPDLTSRVTSAPSNPRRQCVASFAVLPPRSKLVTSHIFVKRDTIYSLTKKWGTFCLLPWSCTFCNISRAYKTTVLGIFLSRTQLKLIYTDYLRIAILDKTFVKNLADPNLNPNPDSEILSPDFKLDFIRPIFDWKLWKIGENDSGEKLLGFIHMQSTET